MTNEIKKTTRSQKGMRPLAYSLKPLTQKAFGKKSSLFGQLILEWNSVVTGLGCEKVTPVKLNFPRGKNNSATLSLAASSSQAFTLQHATPQILQRINQFFGYKAVDKINFIHQTSQAPILPKTPKSKKISAANIQQLENKLEFIENDEMKKALVALGKSVIHKDQTDSLVIKKD